MISNILLLNEIRQVAFAPSLNKDGVAGNGGFHFAGDAGGRGARKDAAGLAAAGSVTFVVDAEETDAAIVEGGSGGVEVASVLAAGHHAGFIPAALHHDLANAGR